MISAYFDVKPSNKPRKAASVPVKDACKPACKAAFKPGNAKTTTTCSPQAVTAGLTMHAQFRPLPESPNDVIVGSYVSESGWMDSAETAEGLNSDGLNDDQYDMESSDKLSDYLDDDSLTDATTTAIDEDDMAYNDLDTDLDAAVDAVDAQFFRRRISRQQRTRDRLSVEVVFSGPMLCCEDEDFD